MKLYGFYRSSASYRARIALNYKGLAYEGIEIDLRAGTSAQRSAQFLTLNPEGRPGWCGHARSAVPGLP